jgi:hypothetical protein
MKTGGDPGGSTAPAVTARGGGIVHDTSIGAYRGKRDVTRTTEPAPAPAIGPASGGRVSSLVVAHKSRKRG